MAASGASVSRIIPRMMRRRTFAATLLGVPAAVRAQIRSLSPQKVALLDALTAIRDESARLKEAHRTTPGHVAELADSLFRSSRWLASIAERWLPKDRDEGKPLLTSIERLLEELEGAPADPTKLEEVLRLLDEDLSAKAAHCRAKGLAALQRVTVVTKREALHEVKGLEVLYIEKFLQFDTAIAPYQFRRFSSPAVDEIAPGRYVFWAKAPGANGQTGARKEARIGNGSPSVPIEVLAP